MSKNKPQTIADLDINWTFSGYSEEGIHQKIEKCNQQNEYLKDLKVKAGQYEFLIFKDRFDFTLRSPTSIGGFIEWINCHVYNRMNDNTPIKLVKFELISNNTFKIHVKE